MIADSVAFLSAAGQAGHLRRRALLRRLARRPRVRAARASARRRAGARERHALRHQRRVAAARGRAATAAVAARSAWRVGIHAHNDAECGVANSLAAVRAGATMVQGTLNGYGERCGNANLVSIIPNLQLKLGLGACRPIASRT